MITMQTQRVYPLLHTRLWVEATPWIQTSKFTCSLQSSPIFDCPVEEAYISWCLGELCFSYQLLNSAIIGAKSCVFHLPFSQYYNLLYGICFILLDLIRQLIFDISEDRPYISYPTRKTFKYNPLFFCTF